MIWTLRIVFMVVLVAMLAVTTWASNIIALWKTPMEVLGHPWFVATLYDTYFAFLTFWLWVAYKQRGWGSRIGWLLGILVLGNIAMATYMLIQLFKLPADAKIEELILRRS
jgi:hypothetical protein